MTDVFCKTGKTKDGIQIPLILCDWKFWNGSFPVNIRHLASISRGGSLWVKGRWQVHVHHLKDIGKKTFSYSIVLSKFLFVNGWIVDNNNILYCVATNWSNVLYVHTKTTPSNPRNAGGTFLVVESRMLATVSVFRFQML